LRETKRNAVAVSIFANMLTIRFWRPYLMLFNSLIMPLLDIKTIRNSVLSTILT
jgi:hypothetical protein